MEFNIPHAMQVEHEELHANIENAIDSGGKTEAAAKGIDEGLPSHFENEEKYLYRRQPNPIRPRSLSIFRISTSITSPTFRTVPVGICVR